MSTPELAKQKWRRKVTGDRWKAGVSGKADEYCSGIARFLGVSSCNPEIKERYRQGVDAVTAEMFNQAVAGKEEKWFENYKKAMVGY